MYELWATNTTYKEELHWLCLEHNATPDIPFLFVKQNGENECRAFFCERKCILKSFNMMGSKS